MTSYHNTIDPVDLAARLVRCNTVTDENSGIDALELLAAILTKAGFGCDIHTLPGSNPNCLSLTARLNRESKEPSLLFGGHVDTVPLGTVPWSFDPLAGDVVAGKLRGRGACDMKGGLAAMVAACVSMADSLGHRDLVLHVYGGEETGCKGSFHVLKTVKDLGVPGAAVICEPSNLVPLAGHKGALWVKAKTIGKTAHASMPDKGENALAKLLPAANRLLAYCPAGEHPVLGTATSVLSTLHAGLNSNSVPDSAVLSVDMRTVPGQDHATILREIAALAGEEVEIEPTLDIPPVWTPPDDPWFFGVLEMSSEFLGGHPGVRVVNFFTDAAAIRIGMPDLPLCILGPGDPALAHVTDEVCPAKQIETATSMYRRIIAAWYGV